ncbi:MAG: helix-turn-helix transcriptional regulator [Nitrospirota bacterium]|nr:MAG: helix-turn-helix transcriptional regulator [Nitrospirota bacterium]
MPIGSHIQAWRQMRKYSVANLAKKANLEQEELEAIEKGEFDPSVSIVEALAEGLSIPSAWLHYEPSALKLLLADPDDEDNDWLEADSPDPVTARILSGTQYDRTLYVLLTSLLQHGEPKLLRAAEVNLRSLLKQAQRATVPWQSRTPGHFEPPSD